MLKIIVIIWFVGAAIIVHSRGKVKTPWKHRFTGFFTLLAPFNVIWYIFSGVPHKPYIDRSYFPELQPLRDNWKTIRDEVIALNNEGHLPVGTGLAFKTFYQDDRWRRFYLTWYGKQYEEAEELMPKTLKLIEGIPSINAAIIARLNPGKTLKQHRDPFSVSLRYHLGLITPNSEDCRIHVDGEMYYWKDGEDVIFDETFVHEATNDTDQERYILFCDLQRPMRGGISQWFAARTHSAIGYLTAGDNAGSEKNSSVNDFYDNVLYPNYRKLRLFRRNYRKLYYLFKYILVIGLLLLIFL